MRKSKQQPLDQRYSILALDDDPIITSTLQAYFQRSGYQVDTEQDPERAIERIRTGSYDILLLDFLMTPICGDQVVAEIRKFNRDLFIILLTGHKSVAPPIKTIRELDIQGYYEKSDRFDQLELLVESCVKSIRQMRTIRQYQQDLSQAYSQLQNSYGEIVNTLRLMVDARDLYTRGHSDRVSRYAVAIARAMGLDEKQCETIRVAGLFHDIGKVGVPDHILLKPGALTDEEYEIVQKHPESGARILSALSMFQDIIPLVRAHHERLDGAGYPAGLTADEIPLGAKIIAVADCYDAMTSNRTYRRALSPAQALEQLNAGRGTQFDPAAVDAFLSVSDRLLPDAPAPADGKDAPV